MYSGEQDRRATRRFLERALCFLASGGLRVLFGGIGSRMLLGFKVVAL